MIHKYEQNGSYIVLDICSGGVHVVDKLVYDLLDYAKPPFADKCPDEIISKMADYEVLTLMIPIETLILTTTHG